MKKLVALLMMLIVCFSLNAQTQTLAKGTIVNVKLATKETTKNMSKVKAKVAAPIISAKGDTLIAAETPVIVQKENCNKARGMGREGSMTLRVISTTAVDGQMVNLDGKLDLVGQNRRGGAIACGVVFGIIFCPIGFLGFCHKGTQATAKRGTIIPSTVVNDMNISAK